MQRTNPSELVIGPAHSPLELLRRGVGSLVRYRALIIAMGAVRLKVRYRHSILGCVWALLQPIALMLLYGTVFSRLREPISGGVSYFTFVFAGLVPWSFCATSIGTAASGMLVHQHLIKQVYFPREIIPISYVVASMVDLALSSTVLIGAVGLESTLSPIQVLWLLPVASVLVMLVTAACLLISAVQVRVRDLSVALPLILQILMFTAPVVYPASLVPDRISAVYWANPFALLISAFRSVLLEQSTPDVGAMVYCAAVSIVSLVGSYILFKRLEASVVDEI